MTRILRSDFFALFVGLLLVVMTVPVSAQQKKHNVIIVVADGLRHGSVTAEAMPTFYRLRTEGVDFRNSHSLFPTFTTANASAIATGHGLGDTGDYSNVVYPGVWLTKPETIADSGYLMPFLENDEVLADINAVFSGNYLGERTLLSVAREHGFNVASVGKLGPTAIQQNDAVSWDQGGVLDTNGAIIVDDATGSSEGLPLPIEITEALRTADLPTEAPTRTNGYSAGSQQSNGNAGDAQTPGTLAANRVQLQWFADVTTEVLLPRFAASYAEEKKPFVLLFWSRDPDGTQHNQGDSLQNLNPGINGPTVAKALHNVDHDLKQILDWLDAHPEMKATTDVIVTSDHGFSTVSRREVAADGTTTAEPSAALTYELAGKEKPEPQGTLPPGFLGIDLAIRNHLHLFDASVRATAGPSVYAELVLSGERSQHPVQGNALLGESVKQMDGSDAKLLLASNGGSDILYIPGKDPAARMGIFKETLETLTQLDYVGGIFVDDSYCTTKADCAGALPLSAVGLLGASKLPRPAIVVTFKNFSQHAGDLQTTAQVSDTTLQEGQGMHGAFGRDQTFNNMAAIGPDFKTRYVDEAPMGNIDIVPTVAHILGLEMPSVGKLRGRVVQEALAGGAAAKPDEGKTLVSAPASNGIVTRMEYQSYGGVSYYDRACMASKADARGCE